MLAVGVCAQGAGLRGRCTTWAGNGGGGAFPGPEGGRGSLYENPERAPRRDHAPGTVAAEGAGQEGVGQ